MESTQIQQNWDRSFLKGLKFWRWVFWRSHFAPAFLFLSPDRRKALGTLYAVCRVLDDAVDQHQDQAREFLAAWKSTFEMEDPSPLEPFGQRRLGDDFLETARQYGIPSFAMLDLINKGVSIDLEKRRFQTPLETESYCYGVAGTVGLACLPIFGVPVPEGKMFAIRMGITVQWINLIRDVGIDARMGRIYLPLDHLSQFGYMERDLLSGVRNGAFFNLMKYEATVARSHYRRALELLPQAYQKLLLPARVMGRVYVTLLGKIESKNFPVFDWTVKLNGWEKLTSAASEWLDL